MGDVEEVARVCRCGRDRRAVRRVEVVAVLENATVDRSRAPRVCPWCHAPNVTWRRAADTPSAAAGRGRVCCCCEQGKRSRGFDLTSALCPGRRGSRRCLGDVTVTPTVAFWHGARDRVRAAQAVGGGAELAVGMPRKRSPAPVSAGRSLRDHRAQAPGQPWRGVDALPEAAGVGLAPRACPVAR